MLHAKIPVPVWCNLRTSPERAPLRALLLSLALLADAPFAAAQTTWYTVELIVFQHLSDNGLYTEHWPTDPGRPSIDDAIRLSLSSELSLEEEDTDQGSEAGLHAFQLLEASHLQLTEAAARLKRSQGYRPLLHIGWRQPGFTRSESRAVHIHTSLPNRYRIKSEEAQENQSQVQIIGAGLENTLGLDPRLALPSRVIDGTLRLSRARYLHLDADLLHKREVPFDAPIETDLFRMRDSRRMRSREVHYIDHPLIGLLVLVTPYEPLEPDLEGDDETVQSE